MSAQRELCRDRTGWIAVTPRDTVADRVHAPPAFPAHGLRQSVVSATTVTDKLELAMYVTHLGSIMVITSRKLINELKINS